VAADPARLLAFDVLRAVADEDAFANIELSRLLRERRMSGRDAALATELVGGTLRMRGAYDAVVDQLVARPLDEPVRDALRLGTHQLLSMRVPTHAAVGTTVDLVKRRVGHRPAGLVNAVLRKVAARSLEEWLEGHDVAERFSHPAWVVDALARALGRPEELEALLRADNERPAVTLVARPGLATREELGGTPLEVSPYAVSLPGGDPGALPAVREGRAGVQDAGSQLVALALSRAHVEGTDEPRYVALVSVADGGWRLASAGHEEPVDLAYLETHWLGRAHVFWRDFERLGPAPVDAAMPGPAVDRLRALLERTGVASVRDFQREHRLAADGLVGPLTRIVLYATVGGYATPSLGGATGAPS